jgi:hypothetical protein
MGPLAKSARPPFPHANSGNRYARITLIGEGSKDGSAGLRDEPQRATDRHPGMTATRVGHVRPLRGRCALRIPFPGLFGATRLTPRATVYNPSGISFPQNDRTLMPACLGQQPEPEDLGHEIGNPDKNIRSHVGRVFRPTDDH